MCSILTSVYYSGVCGYYLQCICSYLNVCALTISIGGGGFLFFQMIKRKIFLFFNCYFAIWKKA